MREKHSPLPWRKRPRSLKLIDANDQPVVYCAPHRDDVALTRTMADLGLIERSVNGYERLRSSVAAALDLLGQAGYEGPLPPTVGRAVGLLREGIGQAPQTA
jgi:hypothetical protein